MFIKSLSGPAIGTIEPPKTGTNRVVETHYVTLEGQNFYLSYPDKYRKENTGQHAVNILESYRLTAAAPRGGLARLVAVTVFDVQGGMTETSAYKTRIKNSSTYQKTVKKINGYEVHFFDNKQTPETVAFIQKGNRVATIAFSGGIADEKAQSEFDHIIDSWKWL